MIPCPICGTKTRVVETRVTGASARRRRSCRVTRCTGKVTTVEVAVREGAALFAKGSLVVPARQIAKLREIVAALVVDASSRQVAKLAKLVAAIEGGAL